MNRLIPTALWSVLLIVGLSSPQVAQGQVLMDTGLLSPTAFFDQDNIWTISSIGSRVKTGHCNFSV